MRQTAASICVSVLPSPTRPLAWTQGLRVQTSHAHIRQGLVVPLHFIFGTLLPQHIRRHPESET